MFSFNNDNQPIITATDYKTKETVTVTVAGWCEDRHDMVTLIAEETYAPIYIASDNTAEVDVEGDPICGDIIACDFDSEDEQEWTRQLNEKIAQYGIKVALIYDELITFTKR